MKVLVTGGAGFIGSHLVAYYLSQNALVWCVDNLLTGRPENLAEYRSSQNLRFLEKDVTSLSIEKLPNDFNLVFHLASPASPVDYQRYPLETMRVNSLGTEKMLRLALKCEARFLYSSTSEVYGDPEIPVQPETYWGRVNPVGPRSVYDEAKRYGEAITMLFHRYWKANTAIARIFNTYGPGMKPDDGRVIPNFINQLLTGKPLTVYGDGQQTRSLCYIDDLVEGIVLLAKSDEHQPVNLGNPEEFTILQLVAEIEKIAKMPVSIEYRPLPEDDPKRRKPDISRAKQLLGWEPKVSLKVGLSKTLDYFQSQIHLKK
ncbi:MAG: SDR family oxidoreductase [Candidatus Omnitrophica bacterium]|nr:SDR family oxidoreductase [Candidatus Omnitrophota bacterium]